MNKFALILSATALSASALLQSCADDSAGRTPLARAEQAYADSRYGLAQTLCDSLVSGESYKSLSVSDLCRLSLLFMRLGDTSGDIDSNTAMAARTLTEAIERNPDSTLRFLNSVPVEDQARVAILTAIHEAHSTPEEAVEPDSTEEYDY